MNAIGNFIFAPQAPYADYCRMEIGDLIAANLEALIKRKGANPSAVAKAAGMGHTGVRDIILRKAKNPAYATLLKIADVLEVDVSEITSGPASLPLSPEQRELLDVWSQLPERERQFLIKSAKAQVGE